MAKLTLRLLREEFSIHRLNAEEEIPRAVLGCSCFWVGKTDDELSIVCDSRVEISGAQVSHGWSCLQIMGPLDLSLTGVLSGLSSALAAASISIFVLSTYDTEYILVKSGEMDRAIKVLEDAGYTVQDSTERVGPADA